MEKIPQTTYQNRHRFPKGFTQTEVIAAVGGEFAIIGEVHVGEERTITDEVGFKDRMKFNGD